MLISVKKCSILKSEIFTDEKSLFFLYFENAQWLMNPVVIEVPLNILKRILL